MLLYLWVLSYLYRVGIALSMFVNVLLGGPIGQTISARQYDLKRDGKFNFSKQIDILCGEDHCMSCWAYWKVRKW
jgi:hypothetical protein